MTTHGDMVMQFGGMPVGEIVQGNTYFVDNSKSAANDNNTGRNWKEPKMTIQSAIDESIADKANGGHRIYVMGSPTTDAYYASGHHTLTGTGLYGVYREKLNIYYTAYGIQLFGINRPFITGQVGTAEDLTGYLPTIQIGSVGVASTGPNFVHIRGFHIGGFGDDGDDAQDHFVYGTGIAIGQYDDTLSDDVYSTLIDYCTFRSSNDAGDGQTNDEEIHTWIKGFGTEKTRVKHCLFFGGQHAIAMNGSTLNNCMFWDVDDCLFLNQKTYTLYSSGSPLWCTVRNSVISPAATNTEMFMTGGTYSAIVNCSFPMCDETVLTQSVKVNTPTIGQTTGWSIMNCSGQKGLIFGAN